MFLKIHKTFKCMPDAVNWSNKAVPGQAYLSKSFDTDGIPERFPPSPPQKKKKMIFKRENKTAEDKTPKRMKKYQACN